MCSYPWMRAALSLGQRSCSGLELFIVLSGLLSCRWSICTNPWCSGNMAGRDGKNVPSPYPTTIGSLWLLSRVSFFMGEWPVVGCPCHNEWLQIQVQLWVVLIRLNGLFKRERRGEKVKGERRRRETCILLIHYRLSGLHTFTVMVIGISATGCLCRN